jgi:hypothetical protein
MVNILTATGTLMLAALLVFATGMIIDPRLVNGAPAWLKPAKFAISTAIYLFTVAWLYRQLTVWKGVLRATAWILSSVLVVEVAIIAMQAARGVPSHFNAGSPFDGAMFSIMGVAIAILWVGTIVVFAALMRQRFDNPAWGWWLRLGVLITVIGAAAGGSMLRMTPEQAAAKRAGQRLTAIGGHTVGATDGGRGLPGTGWSTEHGDLRIAHFFGLHGMQLLPFLGWLAARRYRVRVQMRLAFIAAASYTAFIGIVWWQALRGQPFIAPDATTLSALAVWLSVTAMTAFLACWEYTAQSATTARHGA